MATSSSDSVFNLQTSRYVIPVGATNLVLIDGNAIAGANSVMLKLMAGGTCEIHGVAQGVTYSAAQGASLFAAGSGYPLDVAERLPISGPIRFYIMATGATATVAAIWGRTLGT